MEPVYEITKTGLVVPSPIASECPGLKCRMATIQGPTKQDSPELTAKQFREPPHDFSLVLGGPHFQLFRRLHFSGDTRNC